MSAVNIVLMALFLINPSVPGSLPDAEHAVYVNEVSSKNTLEYFRQRLLNRDVWLKQDVVFGRMWYGRRKDVTNVLEDGVWYRAHALAERDPDRFIFAAAVSEWGSNFCETHYTPHVLYRGERVRIFEVSQKSRNILVAYVRAQSDLKTGIFFDFEQDALRIPSEHADDYLSKIFAFSEEEFLADQSGTITIGMSEAEVLEVAGPPFLRLMPEPGVVVYVYDNFKVIIVEGMVERIIF